MAKRLPRKPPIDFADDRPVYDRQPDEPDKQWFAFRTYRDLPAARAYRPVAEAYQKKYGGKGKIENLVNYLTKQSVHWRWRDRCAEWDRTIDTRIRNRKLRAIEEMEARHLELAQEASSTAMIGLRAIKKLAEEAEGKGEVSLAVDSVLKLASFGIGTERVVQGEPATIEEKRHTVDVDDKRKAMQQLAKNPELLKLVEDELADDPE